MLPFRRRPTTAVLFDAAGVLLAPDPAAFRTRLAPFGVTPDDGACLQAHYAGMAELDRSGSCDYAAADRAVARALGIDAGALEDAAAAVFAVYRQDPYVPLPGAAEQLRRLAAAGYALAVVSNAQGTVEAQLAAHGICSVTGEQVARVGVVIDSHIVGVEKPDPAIFGYALAALGVAADECLYVGDSVHFDVGGAQAAGIAPVHLAPFGGCTGDHADAPSLRSLVDALLA